MSQMVQETLFCAIDFETTGLRYGNGDRIVEYGALKFKNRTILDRFAQLCNPGISISNDAYKVHNISDADVAGKPSSTDLLPEFLKFIDGCVLIAHNASFDLGFLRAELQHAQSTYQFSNRVIDTVSLARKAFPNRASYRLEELRKQLNLPDLQSTHNLQSHRGDVDSESCMHLFLRCVEELGVMGDMPLEEILQKGI